MQNIDRRKFVSTAPRKRHIYIAASLFAVCIVIYYFGEVINTFGWQSLYWEGFYTVHDVHRALFLAPIVYAGYFFRIRGALFMTLGTFIVCLPRALFISPYPDSLLRMVIFVIVAGIVGSFTAVLRNEYELRGRMDALVKNEKDKLMSILEGIRDGVIIIGPDYKVRFLNSSMRREFGEGIGSYCYEYIYKLDAACKQICKLASVINGATERWDYTFTDGRTFDVIATPFLDSDGEVCQLTTYRNITQRKSYEMELLRTSQLKSELLSNVSHELRSPLTSIKGIISSLLHRDIEFDKETKDMLMGSVIEETDRLASLVTNLLDMSKLESGVWKPEKRRCHILDITNEALARQKWVHPKHVFEVEAKHDLPDIYADYGQIRQVLINLLENAAAYSEEGTKVILRAAKVDDELEVSISDQGVGIYKEDLAKVFDKFYRGVQKRQRHWGVGLGLAICQTIILGHGGRIWVESKPGHGSTFYFVLPLAPAGVE
ncbi:MAG: PAS domain-containing sensor histidine kinase [Dehalococcoidia bacterium]